MAILVLTDAAVSINGNDVSAHVTQVTLTYNATLQESTVMGNTTHQRIGGLKDWKVELELEQDYAAGNIDSILFPLVGTTFTLLVKASSAANSTSNPQYSGTGILESYTPVAGKVGDLAKTPVAILAAGALTRLTS